MFTRPGLPIEGFHIVWIIGIAISTVCFILQLVMFILLPKVRKLDQKIISQMTLARLLNTIFEYLFLNVEFAIVELILTLYIQTDAALVCWMFVFSKNLYNKVIVVLDLKKMNFPLICTLIWTLTAIVGLLCPLSLYLGVFYRFYDTYEIIKFIILTVNIVFLSMIFYVVIQRNEQSDPRSIADAFKSIIIAFILVTISSLQVYANDLSTYFIEESEVVSTMFSVINSFQVVAMTVIFVILVKSAFLEWLRKP